MLNNKLKYSIANTTIIWNSNSNITMVLEYHMLCISILRVVQRVFLVKTRATIESRVLKCTNVWAFMTKLEFMTWIKSADKEN